MTDRRSFLGLLATTGVSSASTQTTAAQTPPESVSLIRLIANPDIFHSRIVRVVGFCRLEFEGNALYLHREDFERVLLAQAVQLDLSWPLGDKYRELSDTYVIIEGRFNGQRRGRASAYAGEIGSLSRFERYPSRAEHEALLRLGKQ